MVTKVVVEVSSRKSRARNWTDMEVNLYAAILIDEQYNFAASLENLSAQKSSNKEAFSHIKDIFDKALNEAEFKGNIMLKYFPNDGVSNFEPLDTSAEKLRKKYNNLKAEWRKRTEQAKRIGGVYLDREPRWFALLNTVFTAASDTANVIYHPISLVYPTDQKEYYPIENKHSIEQKEYCAIENRHGSIVGDKECCPIENTHTSIVGYVGNGGHQETTIENNNVCSEIREKNNDNILVTKTCKTKRKKSSKFTESCHRKRKSQNRQLNGLTNSVQELTTSLLEIKKLSMENEFKRDQMFLKFFTEEAEKNRAHELRLAEMYHGYVFSTAHGAPMMTPVPMAMPVNSFPKPRRRSMIFNQNRGGECIPTHYVANTEVVVSSSNATTPRIDSFYSVPQEDEV